MAIFVQGNIHQNGASSSTTVAVTLGATVGIGDSICVAVGGALTNALDSITVQDDKGNTYNPVDTGFNSAAGYSLYTFQLTNIRNGPQTITATDNTQARDHLTIMVDEFSGVTAIDGHSLQAQSSGNTGTDAMSSGTYTTAQNGDVVWGVGISIASHGLTLGSGFTVGGSNNVAGTFMTEYEVQSAASASTAATFTLGAADTTIAASMAFTPAGAPTALPFANTMQTKLM